MVKEIERAGIPVVHICTVTPISHPLGNPALSLEEERAIRRRLLEKALHALSTPVTEQTIFEDSNW